MHFNELFQLGLTKAQARVLDALIEFGENKASDIAKMVKHPRGVVYKLLEELVEMSLAEKIEKSRGVAVFRPCHPGQLDKLIIDKQNELNKNKKILEEIMPSLVSTYNLAANKPGIKFFEGEEGFKKILFDTLTSKTDIYLLINEDAVEQEKKFKEINEEYISKRERAGVNKKVIVFGRAPFHEKSKGEIYEKLTQSKYTNRIASPFKASIQIYDNKISYQILDKDKAVGILIEDINVYQMHKEIFEIMWGNIQ